jgi:hypothetical protein
VSSRTVRAIQRNPASKKKKICGNAAVSLAISGGLGNSLSPQFSLFIYPMQKSILASMLAIA